MRKSALALALALLVALATASPVAAQTFNQTAPVSTSSTSSALVAAVSGKQIYVYGLDLYAVSSTTMQILCGSTALTGAMTTTSYSKPLVSAPAYWACPVGAALNLSLGGLVQTSGAVWFRQQ